MARAAAILAAVMLALAAPVRPSGAATTTVAMRYAPVYMHVGYQPTLAELQVLAANYDLVATGAAFGKYIATVRSLNPSIRLFPYVNGLYSEPTQSFPEDWYAHDALGRRITTFQFGRYLMSPTSAGWRDLVVTTCNRLLVSDFNGCFLDNLGIAVFTPSYATGVPVDPTGKAYTPAQWLGLTSAFASAVQTATAHPVMPNGVLDGPRYRSGPTSLLATVSGFAQVESFLRSPSLGATSYPSPTSFAANVDMLADAEARGYQLGVVTKMWVTATTAQQDQWHEYALAAFLLGASGRSRFSFSTSKQWSSLADADPWDSVAVGTPTAAYALSPTGLYSRPFTTGLVLANPGTTSLSFTLPMTYRRLDGTLLSGTVTVPPRSGMVLRKV